MVKVIRADEAGRRFNGNCSKNSAMKNANESETNVTCLLLSRKAWLFNYCCFFGLSLTGQVSDSVSSRYELNEVVISATKTENYIRDIPTRINLLTSLPGQITAGSIYR